MLSACSTQLSSRWDERDVAVQKKLTALDKADPKPQEFVALVREFEKNKNDYKNGGFSDYVFVRQVAVNQLTQKLKGAVERQETRQINRLAGALLKIDPGNESIKSIISSGTAELAGLENDDQSTLFSNLAPTSSMAASYNVLVHQSLLNSTSDGRQYRALHETLAQPLRGNPLGVGSPLIQQMSYLSATYGFKFACESEVAAQTQGQKVIKTKPSTKVVKQTLIQYLGGLAASSNINFVIFPDQVYCFAGAAPSNEIDGGEYMSVFRAEFVSLELLVGMLKLVVGDSNIVMADEATKSVWIRSNRTKFIQAFDMARSVDFPEAEIEVQMDLYEVSASLLHRIGLRVPQLIRWGIGDSSFNAGAMKWSDWLKASKKDAMRIMIGDGAFQANAQSQKLYASTLSQPRIRVQDGQRARLFVGDKTPVFSSTLGQGGFVSESVNYVSTGVTLEVEAKIVGPNMIQVAVNLDSTELGALVTTPSGSSANAVTSRTTVTRMTIGDGTTEMLGGYVRRVKSKENDGVPLFGATAISPIGGVSGTKDNDVELLIFITPRIIKPKSVLSNRLLKVSAKNDPRFSAPLILSPNMNSPVRTLFQVPQINGDGMQSGPGVPTQAGSYYSPQSMDGQMVAPMGAPMYSSPGFQQSGGMPPGGGGGGGGRGGGGGGRGR